MPVINPSAPEYDDIFDHAEEGQVPIADNKDVEKQAAVAQQQHDDVEHYYQSAMELDPHQNIEVPLTLPEHVPLRQASLFAPIDMTKLPSQAQRDTNWPFSKTREPYGRSHHSVSYYARNWTVISMDIACIVLNIMAFLSLTGAIVLIVYLASTSQFSTSWWAIIPPAMMSLLFFGGSLLLWTSALIAEQKSLLVTLNDELHQLEIRSYSQLLISILYRKILVCIHGKSHAAIVPSFVVSYSMILSIFTTYQLVMTGKHNDIPMDMGTVILTYNVDEENVESVKISQQIDFQLSQKLALGMRRAVAVRLAV